MKSMTLLSAGMGVIMSLSCNDDSSVRNQAVKANNNKPTLVVEWKRLVGEDGKTCNRCELTEAEILKAVKRLREELSAHGVEVELKKSALDMAAFKKNPVESNRIWLAGKPLEEWLDATAGKSKCCDVCGPADCRTVTVGGRTYESIPAEMIEKAGLRAAAEMVGPKKSSGPC